MSRGEGGGPPKGSKNAYGKGCPRSRKELLAINKDTRFGAAKGPDPVAAQKKWVEARRKNAETREHCKTIAGSSFGKPLKDMNERDFAKIFGLKSPDELTGGHYAAIRRYQQAMASSPAMSAFFDDVSGKQVERKIEAKVTLADLLTGNFNRDG